MTYLQFLLIFLGIPLTIVVTLYKKSDLPNKKEFRFGIILLIFLAVTYTAPWDNYLVKSGVWIYGEDRILGTIGYVPLEEYCFFVLQTILSGLFCFLLQKRIPLTKITNMKIVQKMNRKKIVFSSYLLLFLLGLIFLYFEKSRYLGLILSWGMPVILLQWFFGGNYLLANHKILLVSTLITTFYLWMADGLAISWGIWSISDTYTIGFNLGPLPLEEAIFFLVTNLMVSQGLILFVVMRDEISKITYSLRRDL
ncbi:MAG: lycopene cyclase domain-containing protein [Bacteriovoracaceae bacterium]|nr:lycopene cyclase domain-containing protein [Bacteriovoracaceae bacterium]